jgi:alkylhydroperoxidase family enzyme
MTKETAMVWIEVPDDWADNPKGYVNAHFAPEQIGAALALYRACYEHTALSLREFEGARIRMAEINGCALCQNWRSGSDAADMLSAAHDGRATASVADHGPAPTEEYYANVSAWRESPLYTERERLAIGYAEYLSLDPQGLNGDAEFWARLHAVYTDAEIVDLSYCVFSWFQGRITHGLGLDGACSVGTLSAALAAPGAGAR